MKHKIVSLLKGLIALALCLGVFFLVQRLLMPKYSPEGESGIVEGAFMAEFYRQEDKNFDVIFVGDCEVYENFSPVRLWREYGIHSYIRGSAEQYIWQSYYALEDTLKYCQPEVVVFNIQSLQFNESQSEAYNRMSLDGMRWSKTKVDAIYASMTEEESFIEYVFPILRYHSRWSELTGEDFKYLFKDPDVSFNGYYMRVDVKEAERFPTAPVLADYSFGDNAWKYLDMMRELCAKKGIQLIFIKAPSLYPYWYDEYEAQVEAYAAAYDLPYYNFLELTEEAGIDYQTDTYDGGLHMNLSGAEKLSVYFGKILSEEYGVTDRRGEEKLEKIWTEKCRAYDSEIERQKAYYGIE